MQGIENNLQTANRVEYRTREFHPSAMDEKQITAWADLEARANVPNAFLSPYFVIPAVQHLEAASNVFGVFVEKTQGGFTSLVGAALFQFRKPMRHFPLPHLAAFMTIHSYLSGFLIDRDHVNPVLQSIYEFARKKSHKWHGLHMDHCCPNNFLTEDAAAIASDFRMKWTELSKWQRAIHHPNGTKEEALTQLTKDDVKDYQRRLRRLDKIGTFEWRVARGTDPMDKNINDFLQLEHMGWKRSEGTSLLSNAGHGAFFREMMRGFNRAGRAFFTEIYLNGEIISSTSSLISGKAGFGFKAGWNVNYAKYAPGIINYIQILEHGKELPGDLEIFDSSAARDSYLNRLWPDRREIVEGIFTLTHAGSMALSGVQAARKLKAALLSRSVKSDNSKEGRETRDENDK